MKAIKEIEQKIFQLSPGLMGELDVFLDYLINKKDKKNEGNSNRIGLVV